MGFTLYVLFSLLSFYLGLNCRKESFLKFFLFFILVFPFTNLNTVWHINFQVPIFIFFFFGGIIRLRYNTINLNNRDVNLVFVLVVFLLYILLTLPMAINHSIINIFKDLKFVVFGFLFYFFVKINVSLFIDLKSINKLIKWNFIVSLIIYFLMYKYEIHKLINTDSYFDINEVRYTNYATYILPFFILYCLANSIKINYKSWVFLLIPLLLSGNRTVFLLLMVFILFNFLKKISVKKIIFISSSFLGGLIFAFTYIRSVDESSALFRFKKLFSLDYLVAAINTRLSPFYEAIDSFSFFNYIFGKGIGFAYYIPWFSYRVNLDNYNIYLDSLLPTLYGKYGLFFILPIIVFIFFLKNFSDFKAFKYYLVFFAILSLTNSFIYQSYLPLVFLFTFLLKQSRSYVSVNQNYS